MVLELEPGMPAHQAGLLVGDIVLSVQDTDVVDTNVIIEKLSDVRVRPHPMIPYRSQDGDCDMTMT